MTKTPPPPPEPLFPTREADDRSTHGHRQLIGYLGFVLPWLLLAIARMRPTSGLPPNAVLGSVSAYYYTGAVAAFVGVLCALSVFFFTYRGYRNEYQLADRIAAIVAGMAALGVAFFPTGSPIDPLRPSWWTPLSGRLHYTSAIVLFGTFAVFSIFLFPRSKRDDTATPPSAGKRARNAVYLACGAGILGAMLWAKVASDAHRTVFWAEATALELFAISWLVKGRAAFTLARAAKRTAHYGRYPSQLLADVRTALLDG